MDGLCLRKGLYCLNKIGGEGEELYIIWDSSFGHDGRKGGIICILLGQIGFGYVGKCSW
jgi:hypothetical protein